MLIKKEVESDLVEKNGINIVMAVVHCTGHV